MNTATVHHPIAAAPGVPARRLQLVPSELAFLRFVAGIRALLAVLIGVVMLIEQGLNPTLQFATVVPYLIWAALLLVATLQGWPHAASRAWLWVDAGVLLAASQSFADTLPLFGVFTVLPVVALAVLGGVVPAMALAVVCAAGMFVLSNKAGSEGSLLPVSQIAPFFVLVIGATASLLTRPSRELRQRLRFVDTLNVQSDPRQGLRHQVDTLLEQLALHFDLRIATISLQGPEPRIFQWRFDDQAQELTGPEAEQWVDMLARLPRSLGCRYSADGTRAPSIVTLDPLNGATAAFAGAGPWHELAQSGSHILTLPVMSYGQPFGTLCLHRLAPEFTLDALRWLGDVMHETMPLLERSDLLEQLQRETAAHERERIGRDLHDSAIQPYLGLKYGLEALARQAGPANPVSGQITQLLQMANGELEVLRDVIGGLRSGADPTAADTTPLAALQRQAHRFEVLYGLKVHFAAPNAPRLRGVAAKAVLHMVNEALTNLRRHTSATEVFVQLDVNHTDLVLRLRNDIHPANAPAGNFLPRSLAERAEELGGGVEVRHTVDSTELIVTLPLMGAIA